MPSVIDRYRGALLGQCLGDALGFPVEGHSPESCAGYVEGLRLHGPALARPPFAVNGAPRLGQHVLDELAQQMVKNLSDPAVAELVEKARADFEERLKLEAGKIGGKTELDR